MVVLRFFWDDIIIRWYIVMEAVCLPASHILIEAVAVDVVKIFSSWNQK